MRPKIPFNIKVEESGNPGYVRAQGYLPLFFRVHDLEERYTSITFTVLYRSVEREYEKLSKELAGDTLRGAMIRWAIPRIEESFLSGEVEFSFEPKKDSQKLYLDELALLLIKRLVAEKACEYQFRLGSGRDLYCSAAASEDRAVVIRQELRNLAPTSRPICNACTMPDTNFRCSHLTHPQVFLADGSDQRQLLGAFCEIDQPEIKAHPSQCYAGGHSCWTWIVSPEPEPAPEHPYSARELPTALDFLNAIWERGFGRSLLRLRSVEKTAALSLDCANHEDFRSRLDDLNELFKLMDISDDLLPEESRQIDKRQTFNRMSACIEARIADQAESERVLAGIDDLRAISTMRNKLSHGGSELAAALAHLSIEYPIRNHAKAWDRIRASAAEAFSTIRSSLQTVP